MTSLAILAGKTIVLKFIFNTLHGEDFSMHLHVYIHFLDPLLLKIVFYTPIPKRQEAK